MNVAITGATGHVGAAILRALDERGHEIRALVRGSSDLKSLGGISVTKVKGDILDASTLPSLMQGCDAVIHCAGMISIDGDRTGMVHRVNAEGTRNVLTAAGACGVQRVVHMSTIHVYEQSPQHLPLNEERALVNDDRATAYDRSKKAAHELARGMYSQSMDVVIIAPAGIIGPYDFKPSRAGGAICDLYKTLLPVVTGGGFDFCDSRDVAHATVNALQSGKGGEEYILSGRWCSLAEIAGIVRALSGSKVPVMTCPFIVAKMMLPLIRVYAHVNKQEPIYTGESLEVIRTGNRQIDCTKAMRELGYRARPIGETLYDTIQWFKGRGMI